MCKSYSLFATTWKTATDLLTKHITNYFKKGAHVGKWHCQNVNFNFFASNEAWTKLFDGFNVIMSYIWSKKRDFLYIHNIRHVIVQLNSTFWSINIFQKQNSETHSRCLWNLLVEPSENSISKHIFWNLLLRNTFEVSSSCEPDWQNAKLNLNDIQVNANLSFSNGYTSLNTFITYECLQHRNSWCWFLHHRTQHWWAKIWSQISENFLFVRVFNTQESMEGMHILKD